MNEHFNFEAVPLAKTNHPLDKEFNPLVEQVHGMNTQWERLKLQSPEELESFISFTKEREPEVAEVLRWAIEEDPRFNPSELNSPSMFDGYLADKLLSEKQDVREIKYDVYTAAQAKLKVLAPMLESLVNEYQSQTAPSAHA